MILDEPTTGLDKKSERAVLDALKRLNVSRTTFLITHDLRHAIGADLILYVEGGRIAERGAHDELLRADGRYAGLFRMHRFNSEAEPGGRLAGRVEPPGAMNHACCS